MFKEVEEWAYLCLGMDAPTFKSKAVVNNELSELDLEDYKWVRLNPEIRFFPI